MKLHLLPPSSISTWLRKLVLLVPALLFYLALKKTSVNLPIADDFAALDFLNKWCDLHGFVPRLMHILYFQHNEYKLIFATATLAAEFSLLGHINFLILVAFGSAFVFLVFLLLVSIYRMPVASDGEKILLLLPLSLLLFQLQYAAALVPAIGVLQYLPSIYFSFLAIVLLCKKSRFTFAGACVSALLAIAASINGFIVVFVGFLLLIQQKNWRKIAAWGAIASLSCAVYFTHYDFHTPGSGHGASIGHSFANISVLYALSFMGASIARYQSYFPSICLGIIFTALLLLALKKRYNLKNPEVFYCILLLFVTAVGISGLRSELGMAQSLVSRYRIYSNLLLIFFYMFLSETYLSKIRKIAFRRLLIGSAALFCAVFCASSDLAGYRFLQGRRNAVIYELHAWQNPSSATPANRASIATDAATHRQLESGLYQFDDAILQRSMQLGVYQPSQALPPKVQIDGKRF